MKILVATNHLEMTGGTECYTFAIIQELLRQGHDVEYFAFQLGDVAKKIESLGVKFRSHIFYDLIIANHNNVVDHLYKRGFIIQTCHGTVMSMEQPSPKADVLVSITPEVYDYLLSKGFTSVIIKNGVDCKRFCPSQPLNTRLSSVLSLCQSENANKIVKEACDLLGVHFEKSNKFKENNWEIEKKINRADLVVGIGRSAYDAMACGRAIVSFDVRNYSSNLGDGYLNSQNIEKAFYCNCSGRVLKKTFDAKSLAEELRKYKKDDGAFFREYALKNFDIEYTVKKYIALFPEKKKYLIKLKKLVTLVARNIYWSMKLLQAKILPQRNHPIL